MTASYNDNINSNLPYGLSRLIGNIRVHENITQTELAILIDTKQPAICKLENGTYLPSLSLLVKIANILKYRIEIRFISEKDQTIIDSNGDIIRAKEPPF